jgi:hypothetical protein
MKKLINKTILVIMFVGSQHLLLAQYLQLKFIPIAGNKALVLGDSTYYTALNEPITFRNFLFYVSHIQLIDAKGHTTNLNNAYYLINASDTASLNIQLPVKPQIITAIQFTIGVDSVKNVSGVQTGTLDPMLGMFWTWNTGYIFAKLEGNSPVSKAPAHYVTYHIGGYKKAENAIRIVTLTINNQNKEVHQIEIGANVLSWFSGKTPLSIQINPICHSPGKLAQQIADNYAQMFHLIKVE